MPELFGTMPSGEAVYRHEIVSGGLSAAILTYGAIVQDLRLAGFGRSLVLGLNTLDDYIKHSPYFGAIAGRVANRIAYGRFHIDGIEYQIDRNIDGTHTLHGGCAGIGVKNWQIVDSGLDYVLLEIVSPDGDMGFPGTMTIRCRYSITAKCGLQVKLTAKTDKPCPCNLAPHSYFNLEGEGDVLDHQLMIDAQHVTAISDALMPTGALASVEDTVFDFRAMRQISTGVADGSMRYDHNYCLSNEVTAMREVAIVKAPRSGVEMRLLTTQPGLQLYDGAKISVPVIGADSRYYGANAGFCLETQHWPDAPNQPDFPDIILRPGQRYEHLAEYLLHHK
jgi:aldose 1-epimerase